jgi:hypothetical protein
VESVFDIGVSLFNHSNGVWFVEPGQIEKAGLLMKIVKDCARSVFDVGCRKYSNAVMRQLTGQSCAAVVILEGGDAWRDLAIVLVGRVHTSNAPRRDLTLAWLHQVWMRLVQGLPKSDVGGGYQAPLCD